MQVLRVVGGSSSMGTQKSLATPILGNKSIIQVLNILAALNSGNMQVGKFSALLLFGYLNIYGDILACHNLDCAESCRA